MALGEKESGIGMTASVDDGGGSPQVITDDITDLTIGVPRAIQDITGLGLAELGHHVVNVDIDAARVDRLNRGDSPIYEEGIGPLLRRHLDSGRIRFTQSLSAGMVDSEVVIIAVGSPAQDDGHADLSAISSVAEDLSEHWDQHSGSGRPEERYRVIAIKSTVPVGTAELVRSIMGRQKQEGEDFDIISNPEFLREGKGLHDFFYPDRIVIGSDSERARAVIKELYEPVIQRHVRFNGEEPPESGPVPVVETSLASAQMIKYASNAFLATRISFINEVAWLCERVGADVKEVAYGMGFDSRIGHAYLDAGLGFGGPCLEKDLRALIKISEASGYDPQLMRSVLDRNQRQVEEVVARVKEAAGDVLYQRVITVFGLAFKPQTNDLRNSMSLEVIQRLKEQGATLRAHDSVALPEARALDPDRAYIDDPYEAVHESDALLILTAWPQYAELDYGRIKERMASPCIIDARNLLEGPLLRALGFSYTGIGRGSSASTAVQAG